MTPGKRYKLLLQCTTNGAATLSFVLLLRLIAAALAASALHAAPPIFPLKDIRAGQHGVGRTVFSGWRVEEFRW